MSATDWDYDDKYEEMIRRRKEADQIYVNQAAGQETIIAAKDAQISGDYSDVIYETADLWFHSLVMLAQLGQHPQAVLDELDRRFGLSGHAEKASRPSA